MLRFQASSGRAHVAFTDRLGGDSARPFEGLNLGEHVGDDAEAVRVNRRRVADEMGLPVDHVLYMSQVHGADTAVVHRPWTGAPPAVDAMVTTRPGLGLAVLVADCVPVVLTDARAGVIGVAHAGRAGLVAGVVASVAQAMRDSGARSITATLGPSVCGSCYEVPDDMRAAVAEIVPETWSRTATGTPALDVAAGVAAQLVAEGVEVSDVGECTFENPEFYSYRRTRRTGRFAGLAWLT